jgi:hypothetical protein
MAHDASRLAILLFNFALLLLRNLVVQIRFGSLNQFGHERLKLYRTGNLAKALGQPVGRGELFERGSAVAVG